MKYKTTIRTFPVMGRFGFKIKYESDYAEMYVLCKNTYKTEKNAIKYAKKFYHNSLK